MKKENLLTSWKEVASYLDCDVRTCHRWEKEFGLPVHRLGDSSHSRVFAYREELDLWMEERGNNNHRNGSAAADSDGKRAIFLSRPIAILAIVLLAAAAAVYLIFFNNPGSSSSRNKPASKRAETWNVTRAATTEEPPDASADLQPEDFRIEGTELIITNKVGRELFRFDTGLDDLMDEAYYRDRFQKKRMYSDDKNTNALFPLIIIKDIDGKGAKEVLFIPQTETEYNEDSLFCFNAAGKLLWTFKAGKRRKYGDSEYAWHYGIERLWVEDLNNNGSFEIFIIADHKYECPTQLAVLTASGKKIGEYWNAGRMVDFDFVDLDGDDRNEIIVAGMNNEYEAPCLIVFDQSKVEGGSPQQKEEFICRSLRPGREMAYVKFPDNKEFLFPQLMESLGCILPRENSTILAISMQSSIEYVFDFDMDLLEIRPTHKFQARYMGKFKAGLLKEPYDWDSYMTGLKAQFRWWDGDGWSATPTMTKYWHSRRR